MVGSLFTNDVDWTQCSKCMCVSGAAFGNSIMNSMNRSDSLAMQEAKMVILKTLEKWTEYTPEMMILTDCGSSAKGGVFLLIVVGLFANIFK